MPGYLFKVKDFRVQSVIEAEAPYDVRIDFTSVDEHGNGSLILNADTQHAALWRANSLLDFLHEQQRDIS